MLSGIDIGLTERILDVRMEKLRITKDGAVLFIDIDSYKWVQVQNNP